MLLKRSNSLPIAVWGMGIEGLAVAEYFKAIGHPVIVFDDKPLEQFSVADQKKIVDLGVEIRFGKQSNNLKGFSTLFRSPGISLDHKQIKLCKKRKIEITSQTKWFFEHCPAQIIGITGTKGKGTTSSLIYEILSLDKNQVYLTGNIGKIQPLQIIDKLSKNNKIVYELSSFQLQDLKSSPHTAIVLMVTEDHLDYHNNIREYHHAKSAITKHQKTRDWAIINYDYPASRKIGEKGFAQKFYFSRKIRPKKGSYWDGEKLEFINIDNELRGGIRNFKLNRTEWNLRGEHNIENVSAAVISCAISGSSIGNIKKGLANFLGLEFRLQKIRSYKQISFYNDSFATVPETTMAALNSFTEPVIAIVGGSDKGADYNKMTDFMVQMKNLKAVIAIGKTGKSISQQLKIKQYSGSLINGGLDMRTILSQTKKIADSGDVVLLSPASASFDMFENYKDRGNQFNKIVRQWEKL